MRHLRHSVSALVLTTLTACGGGGGGGGVASNGSQAPAAVVPPQVTPTSPIATPPAATAPAATVPTTAAPIASTSADTPVTGRYASAVAPASGSIMTPTSVQPVRSVNDTAQFRLNYTANELVNALYALDNGWTGQGVTVGVLDDGVNGSLSAFDGQISPLSKDFGNETRGGVTAKRNRLSDEQADHGTAAAAIIAGRRNSGTTMGIAPEAKIAVLRTSDYNHDTGREYLGHEAEAIDHAISSGIRVINRSLVSDGFNVGLRNAMGRYATNGGLMVNAAGNGGGSDPVDAVNVTEANRGSWLFVVALDPNINSAHTLASYSNKAGALADRTVTAVGTNVTTRVDGSVSSYSGTSSATAQVTGLAALILSKWPQLSGADAGNVILSTARDIGEPGIDQVFGHGLIDVQAALTPSNPTLSNGNAKTSLAGSVMALPAAVGGGSIQTALADVTVLDQYGRDFSGSLAGLVTTPESGRAQWLRRRMIQMADGGSNSFAFGRVRASFAYGSYRTGTDMRDVGSVMTSGDFAYQAGRTGFRLGVNAQDSLQSDIMGLAPFANGVLAYAPEAGNSFEINRMTAIGQFGVTLAAGSFGMAQAKAMTLAYRTGSTSVRASWIDEAGAVMGAASQGALSLGRGARTIMLEAHHSVDLAGGWTMEGYGSLGLTRLKIDPVSIVTGATALVGSRAGLQASRLAMGGLMSLGIAQPLTIESGRADLTLGSGYDFSSRSLVHRTTRADLASGSRRLQLTAGYVRGTATSSLRMGLMMDASDGSARALAGYRTAF